MKKEMKNNKILMDQLIKDYDIDLDDFFDISYSDFRINFLGKRNLIVETKIVKKLQEKFKLEMISIIDTHSRFNIEIEIKGIYIEFRFIKKI